MTLYQARSRNYTYPLLSMKKALSEAEEMCTFSFQGGELTLVGRVFKSTLNFKQSNKSNIKIENSIQTNGMLIDEDWAAFG